MENARIMDGPVAHILGRNPHWLIRWGLSILVLALIGLLGITWVIRYPDVISAPVTLTTALPPIKVVAQSDGKLQSVFVENGDQVLEGDTLALIQNTAHYPDVLRLERLLESHGPALSEQQPDLPQLWPRNLNLGEIQPAYTDFQNALQRTADFLAESHYSKTKASLGNQKNQHALLGSQLERKQSLLQRDLTLAERKYDKVHALFRQKLISESDLFSSEELKLAKQQALQNVASELANHRIRQDDLNQRILELDRTHQETLRQYRRNVRDALKDLELAMDRWQARYLLQTPIDGIVSLFQFRSPGQFVRVNQEVFTLVPEKRKWIAKIQLAQRGAGKVAVGQSVRLKLNGFPYRQFGALLGTITAISPVAEGDTYLLDIQLDQGLTTSYGKTLSARLNMDGTADIITEEMRLIERFLSPFRYLFHPNAQGGSR